MADAILPRAAPTRAPNSIAEVDRGGLANTGRAPLNARNDWGPPGEYRFMGCDYGQKLDVSPLLPGPLHCCFFCGVLSRLPKVVVMSEIGWEFSLTPVVPTQLQDTSLSTLL